MPRKQQGWITFQTSELERQQLEQFCEFTQRTKTDVLRELLRSLSPDMIRQLSTQDFQGMNVSARNLLKGTVKQIVLGAVNAEVTLEIAPGIEVTSVITKASAERLGLEVGKQAYAVIKSSDVMIAVD
jgi:molybdopterin-binding protein